MPYAYEPYKMSSLLQRYPGMRGRCFVPCNLSTELVIKLVQHVAALFLGIRNETMRVSQFLKYDTQLVKLLRQLDGDAYFKAISIS